MEEHDEMTFLKGRKPNGGEMCDKEKWNQYCNISAVVSVNINKNSRNYEKKNGFVVKHRKKIN